MCNEKIIPLILNYRKNDEKAFLKIYKVFENLIFFYNSKMCCEDGASELTLALLEILHKIDLTRFECDDSFAVQKYIAVGIRNKYIDISKKGRKEIIYTQPFAEVKSADYECIDDRIMVAELFSLLNRRQQLILRYKYFCGYNDVAIAKLMGISRQAVNGIKLRAFDTIKKFYKF